CARTRAAALRPESRVRPAEGRRSGTPRRARRPPEGAARRSAQTGDMRPKARTWPRRPPKGPDSSAVTTVTNSLPGAHLLRMPAPVRRKLIFACLSISALALVLTGTALADVGRGVPPAEAPN